MRKLPLDQCAAEVVRLVLKEASEALRRLVRPGAKRQSHIKARRLEMTERERDRWAERRDELTRLVGRLTAEEALAIVRRVVAECTDGRQVAPALASMIRRMVEPRAHQGADSPSEAAYHAMKDHSPNLGDK